MKVVLQSGNVRVLVKTLNEEDREYQRLAEASILEFQGLYYRYNGMRSGELVFGECSEPVNVDNWLEN